MRAARRAEWVAWRETGVGRITVKKLVAAALLLSCATAVAQTQQPRDMDGWILSLQRLLEQKFDMSGATMSPFGLAEYCVRGFAYNGTTDRFQREDLLNGRDVVIGEAGVNYLLSCAMRMGAKLRP